MKFLGIWDVEISRVPKKKTVEEYDAELEQIRRNWRLLYVIRQHLAKERGDNTPPPEPPSLPQQTDSITNPFG